MKISIISVVYNNVKGISGCIDSVHLQKDVEVEHVIIDGFSTDGTQELIENRHRENDIFISEPDRGIYDALNKGFEASTGEILGILHSDDRFHDDQVLLKIRQSFMQGSHSVIYGNALLGKFQDENRFICRRDFKSGAYRGNLGWGWMPPHPALFIRRGVWGKIGTFDTELRIASDYDWMVRLFSDNTVSKKYLDEIFTHMALGGISTGGVRSEMRKLFEDSVVIRRNNLPLVTTLLGKKLRKLFQFRMKGN